MGRTIVIRDMSLIENGFYPPLGASWSHEGSPVVTIVTPCLGTPPEMALSILQKNPQKLGYNPKLWCIHWVAQVEGDWMSFEKHDKKLWFEHQKNPGFIDFIIPNMRMNSWKQHQCGDILAYYPITNGDYWFGEGQFTVASFFFLRFDILIEATLKETKGRLAVCFLRFWNWKGWLQLVEISMKKWGFP